ncbi:MAG TPA: ribonuclease Z, partial [Candidatus Omnitrophota bacterium]|nr:ribonuclease Z [Candidatus Omnitrophota bacterium]
CTDTEDCQGLRELSRDADLVITECAFRSGEETKGSSHLNPESAATAIAESGAKMLVLYHFDPARYPSLEDRLEAQNIAKRIFGNTVAATDGKEIEI